MRYPRYPVYKPSGVEWLGEVPEHWEMTPNKVVMRMRNEPVGSNSDAYQLLSLTLRGIVKKDATSADGKIPSSYDTYQRVAPGDLVFCLFDMDETPRTVGRSSFSGMITGAYSVFECRNNVEGSFLEWLYIDVDSRKGLRPYYTGLRKAIRPNRFGAIAFPLPPLDEQRAIAAFLDRETAQIDALIAKLEQLIALLQEKRQALISHVVTKGLDPSVPMKDSGVEWLGQVPEHWKVKRLRWINCLAQTGPFGSQLHTEDYVEGGFPVVNPQNLREGAIIPKWRMTVDEATRTKLERHVLQEGDIVFGRRGEMGRAAIVTKNEVGWLCGTGSILIRLYDPTLNPNLLALYLQLPSSKEYFSLESIGSTMENLNTNIILDLNVVIPPLTEQYSILARCDDMAQLVDKELDLAARQQQLLIERRAALITAAVTGSIDVRGSKI